MPEWHLQTSVCLSRTCYLTYRSADGLLGLAITGYEALHPAIEDAP